MKTLLLMRHAKSSWKDSDLKDFDRPLNKKGKKTAPLMGHMIADQELVPDRIISSPAVRARQTVEAFVKPPVIRVRLSTVKATTWVSLLPILNRLQNYRMM